MIIIGLFYVPLEFQPKLNKWVFHLSTGYLNCTSVHILPLTHLTDIPSMQLIQLPTQTYTTYHWKRTIYIVENTLNLPNSCLKLISPNYSRFWFTQICYIWWTCFSTDNRHTYGYQLWFNYRRKCCVRRHDMVNSYRKSVSQMITSSIKPGKWAVMYLFAKSIDFFLFVVMTQSSLSSFMIYHRVCNKSNPTGATTEAGIPTLRVHHCVFTFINRVRVYD